MEIIFREEPEEILGIGDDSNLIKDPNWRIPVNSKKTIVDTFTSSEFYSCLDHCQKKFKTERALLRYHSYIT